MKLTGDRVRPMGTGMYVVSCGDWRYQEPVTDSARCRNCGACALYCPTNSRRRADSHFETNLDYCKGCGICANECYAFAITMVRKDRA